MRIKVSSDAAHVAAVREALEKNDGYCPCAIEKTDDTKCMCAEFLDREEAGPCHCGLYVKEPV